MSKPRGRTGSVRGLSPKKAREYILAAYQYAIGANRGRFTRAALRDYLMEQYGLPHSKAEGIVFAITRQPELTRRVSVGLYQFSKDATMLIAHRDWRFNVGRLGLADARALVRALDGAYMTPTLDEITRRAKKALRNVGGTR